MAHLLPTLPRILALILPLGACLEDLPPPDEGGDTAPVDTDGPTNGAPAGHAVAFDSSWPSPEQDLGCTVQAHAIDPEGDPISYSFAWTVNGGDVAAASTEADRSTLSADAIAPGDELRCTAVATDGEDGTEASTTLTVASGTWTFTAWAPGMPTTESLYADLGTLWLDLPDALYLASCGRTMDAKTPETDPAPGWENLVETLAYTGDTPTTTWTSEDASSYPWEHEHVSSAGATLAMQTSNACIHRTEPLDILDEDSGMASLAVRVHPLFTPLLNSVSLTLCLEADGCTTGRSADANHLAQVILTRQGEDEGLGQFVLSIGEHEAVGTFTHSDAIVPTTTGMGEDAITAWQFELRALWRPATKQ
jgi:hypothetical protein